MDSEELKKLMAEFEAKGGKKKVLESSHPNSLRFSLGKLLAIRKIPVKKGRYGFQVFEVFLFDIRKKVDILARKEDRGNVEIGKSYSFTYKVHQGMNHIGVAFVTRGTPTEIKTSAQPTENIKLDI